MIFNKIETKISKINFKYKIRNLYAIKYEKIIGTRGLKPGRLGTSPQLLRLRYADSRYWTLELKILRMREPNLKQISYSEFLMVSK